MRTSSTILTDVGRRWFGENALQNLTIKIFRDLNKGFGASIWAPWEEVRTLILPASKPVNPSFILSNLGRNSSFTIKEIDTNHRSASLEITMETNRPCLVEKGNFSFRRTQPNLGTQMDFPDLEISVLSLER